MRIHDIFIISLILYDLVSFILLILLIIMEGANVNEVAKKFGLEEGLMKNIEKS